MTCCVSQTNSISTSFKQYTVVPPPTRRNAAAINVQEQIERVIDKAISVFLFNSNVPDSSGMISSWRSCNGTRDPFHARGLCSWSIGRVMGHGAISVTGVTGPHKHSPNAFFPPLEAERTTATMDNGSYALTVSQFCSVKHCLSLLMSPNYSYVVYLFISSPASREEPANEMQRWMMTLTEC